MAFNLNTPFSYPWNPPGSYVPTAFNLSTRHPPPYSGQSVTPTVFNGPISHPAIQSGNPNPGAVQHPSSNAGHAIYNSNSFFPGQHQYCENMLPFNIGTPYPN